MAIAFDAASEFERTLTTDPQTWTHTPVGTPKAVAVAVIHGTSTTDHVSTVTYGGVSLTEKVRATDSTTEPGASELWFLGASIPTGAQTVSVDLASGTTDDIHFVCMTFTAASNTEVIDTDSISSDNQANPTVTLQYNSRTCMSVAALYGGDSAPNQFTENANCTRVHDVDLGNFYSAVLRQTTAGTADFAIGGTATSDDVAYVAMAITEVDISRALTNTNAGSTGSVGAPTKTALTTVALTGTAGTGAVGTTTATAFLGTRQAIIDGLDSAQAEGTGWDAVVKATLPVTSVVRTSDTVVTITLPAEASYSITAEETITVTVPGAALTGGVPIVATPTIAIATEVVTVALSGLAAAAAVGALAVSLTLGATASAGTGSVGTAALSRTTPVTGAAGTSAAGSVTASGGASFDAFRQDIIDGLDSAQAEGTGWDAVVKATLPLSAVIRTSDTVVTITLPAEASYDITANETITVTVPASILTGASPIVAAPTFAISAADRTAALTGVTSNVAGAGNVGVVGAQSFEFIRQDIINELTSAQSEAAGWNAIVRATLPESAVVRTSSTVVTITLPAEAAYDITAAETITVTVPASALTGGVEHVASPTITIASQDVTSALTGVAATSAVGTVSGDHQDVFPRTTIALTTVVGLTDVGSIVYVGPVDQFVTGVGGASAVGSMAVDISGGEPTSKALTGVGSSGAEGTLTASTSGGGVAQALTGETGTGGVGTVTATPESVVALTGEAATSAVGTVTQTHSGSVALTGVSATGEIWYTYPPVLPGSGGIANFARWRVRR